MAAIARHASLVSIFKAFCAAPAVAGVPAAAVPSLDAVLAAPGAALRAAKTRHDHEVSRVLRIEFAVAIPHLAWDHCLGVFSHAGELRYRFADPRLDCFLGAQVSLKGQVADAASLRQSRLPRPQISGPVFPLQGRLHARACASALGRRRPLCRLELEAARES